MTYVDSESMRPMIFLSNTNGKKKTRLFKQTKTSENKTALKLNLRAAAIQSAFSNFCTGGCC